MPALTRSQRKNLAKLADYLESLPEDYAHFDMSGYLDGASPEAAVQYARKNGGVASCGTVACALGHGPAAGVLFRPGEILPPEDDAPAEPDWDTYGDRFVPAEDCAAWSWLFSGSWSWSDGHHWGAAARIRFILKQGMPPPDYWLPSRDWLPLYREFDKRYAEQVQ